MHPIALATSCSLILPENFWTAVDIYYSRPHLINRKILAIIQCSFCRVDYDKTDITDIISSHGLSYEVNKIDITKEKLNINFLQSLFEGYDVRLSEISSEEFLTLDGIFLSLRIVLPRHKNDSKCVELVIINKNENRVLFYTSVNKSKPVPDFPYEIQLSQGFLRINVYSFEDADTSSAEWLAGPLFDKLIKWSENKESNSNIIKSLTHIRTDDFALYYASLKEKYAEFLIKDWKEITKTNPQKFVFEDISIAAYLLSFWKLLYADDAKQIVKFVDCGCGNGLLVYLLNQEGYQGFGIDLRKRKIWDIFESCDLLVDAVTPLSQFPESTWLIGNHSDELTPWLPIISSKSSQCCNYFVIPCCTYDFSGKKYVRKNTALSQYADYINYIESVSKKCGFQTKIDKLRIPSTKRICIIGTRETDANMEYIDHVIDSVDFKKRSANEPVKNCTQIDRTILQRIVKDIVDNLLSVEEVLKKEDKTEWNKGGKLHLSELCDLLSDNDKQFLKKECGGLQTLVRNHRYLFEIDKGMVSLRLPLYLKDTDKYRNKPCWFFKFHPNGCLFKSDTCAYSHVK